MGKSSDGKDTLESSVFQEVGAEFPESQHLCKVVVSPAADLGPSWNLCMPMHMTGKGVTGVAAHSLSDE